MNKLDMIKSEDRINTFLTDVHFNFEASEKSPLGPHIHMVTNAASRMDEAFLFKSQDVELTEREKEILKGITPKTNKEEIMDEAVAKALEAENADLKTKLEDIQKALKSEKISKSLDGFSFEADIVTGVTGAMLGMDEDVQETIIKAFTFLKELVVEIEETELQKELSSDAGADGDGEVVEKSLNQKIADAREELEKGDK